MLPRFVLITLVFAAGCRDGKDPQDSPGTDDSEVVTPDDADGDGAASDVDCNDGDATVFPGAEELCNGRDDDCDGEVDDDPVDATTWYRDADNDRYGDDDLSERACRAPEGYTDVGGDCDDAEPLRHPGAAEPDCADPVDWNCDGSVGYADDDNDGYAACEDCDDSSNAISPDGVELCDLVDNDCDGTIDEDDAADAGTWYLDADGDGYGTSAYSVQACQPPARFVDNTDDCDDADASVNPDTTWYLDYDSDGYGDPTHAVTACVAPNGYVADASDCNDANATINPTSRWYADTDRDGYGDPNSVTVSCTAPSGAVANDDDCDDTDASLTPNTTWYLDYDSDGFGVSTLTLTRCTQPSGYALASGDCDDRSASHYPGATPGCDGDDYDCDGLVDNDADQDGYADATCGGDDCDDGNANITPEANGGCALGSDCQDVLNNGHSTGDGVYTIDPDGPGNGEDPIEAYCDMTTDGGGWTLCASLTKGYVPAHMLYSVDAYAFQARLNSDRDFVYERDAPARTNANWNASETLNYGQFCRLLGNSVTHTRVEQKSWNWANNYGANARNNNYNLTRSGTFSGNLFTLWFTNSGSGRTFTHVSGDRLYVTTNNNGYGGPYTTPHVGWSSSNQNAPYTHSTNPWNGVNSTVSCVGCTNSGSGYNSLPYGQTTILNNMGHTFWSGIPNVRYGWSDCTANGNCDYHESGYGVWLFWTR